jgi:hypothetical protein
MRRNPRFLNRYRFFIDIANTLKQKDITSCFDRQLLRDFFGTFHDTLVNP